MSTTVPSEHSFHVPAPCARALRRSDLRPVDPLEADHGLMVPHADGWWLQPRPRLLRRIRGACEGGTALVIAPAGCGKSVLLDQLVASMRDVPVVLVKFDRDDDAVTARAAVARAVQDLDGHATSLLVVDGADAPRSACARAEVVSLVAQIPPTVRLVVAARTRIAVDGPRIARAVRLGEIELAFTRDEARLLVQALAGTELSAPNLTRLLDRTRGWAAGVKLAAVGLRDSTVDPADYVEGFGGGDLAVREYLEEEVLDALDPELRQFLARTAVLDRMSPSLCVALTGLPASEAFLDSVEHRGLFVRRITASREWFEYHPMFRDVLRRGLRVDEPHLEAELLERAAAWHGSRGEVVPAAQYLIEAERWDALLDHADRHGRTMLEQGEGEVLVRWLEAIPSRAHADSSLQLRRAYLLATAGEAYRAEEALRTLSQEHHSEATQAVVAALRATSVDAGTDPHDAIDAADEAVHALDRLAPADVPDLFGLTDHSTLRLMATNARARALWYQGDIEASRRVLKEALRLRGYTPWHVQTKGTLALVEAWDGNLRVARQRALDAVVDAARAGLRRHPTTLEARVAMAHVARERGRLQTAARLLDEVDALTSKGRYGALRALVVVERGMVDLAQGRSEHGLAQIQQLRADGEYAPSTGVERRLRAVESRLLVAAGHPARARRCLDVDGDEAIPEELAPAAIEAAVADRDLVLAREYLDRWTVTRRSRARLEHQLWESVLDAETGDRRAAVRRVSSVLSEAREEGHERLFLDPGRPVERVLRLVGHTSPPTSFVRHLVDAIQPAPLDGAREPLGALSDREREIARFLPTPLTSTEIAGQLYISLNTLKTHLRSIYRKLGVQSRDAASKRAQELGLA